MIYVNIPDEGKVEVRGNIGDIIADMCVVLDELCNESEIPPELLLATLKDTFLYRRRLAHRGEDNESEDEEDADLKYMISEMLLDAVRNAANKGVKEDAEDERSKKTVQSSRRRNRRRLD